MGHANIQWRWNDETRWRDIETKGHFIGMPIQQQLERHELAASTEARPRHDVYRIFRIGNVGRQI